MRTLAAALFALFLASLAGAAEAADWAVSSGTPEFLSVVVSSCPESRFTEFADWLTNHREAAYYREAAGAFADRIQAVDPESAAKWRAEAEGSEAGMACLRSSQLQL